MDGLCLCLWYAVSSRLSDFGIQCSLTRESSGSQALYFAHYWALAAFWTWSVFVVGLFVVGLFVGARTYPSSKSMPRTNWDKMMLWLGLSITELLEIGYKWNLGSVTAIDEREFEEWGLLKIFSRFGGQCFDKGKRCMGEDNYCRCLTKAFRLSFCFYQADSIVDDIVTTVTMLAAKHCVWYEMPKHRWCTLVIGWICTHGCLTNSWHPRASGMGWCHWCLT